MLFLLSYRGLMRIEVCFRVAKGSPSLLIAFLISWTLAWAGVIFFAQRTIEEVADVKPETKRPDGLFAAAPQQFTNSSGCEKDHLVRNQSPK
jgi:hypothetical protein